MASRAFSTIFSADVESPNLVRIAVAAARAGYAVMVVPPGTKKSSYCTLTARELKKEGPRHLCGMGHASSDPEKVRKIFARAVKEYGDIPANIGIEAWGSGIVTVDADNAEGVANFVEDWAAATGDPGFLAHTPTVRTPGMLVDGVWVHKNGGHFHFVAPEGLELGRGNVLSQRGYDVRWGHSQALVPPSRRVEGPYETTAAGIVDCPDWVVDLIVESNLAYLKKLESKGQFFKNDTIARWSCSVSWAELLLPDSWGETHLEDSCGCPVFEKPEGGTLTRKSATGHENVCPKYANLEGHGPLHMWTDDPPAPLGDWQREHGKTMTKLQYVAATRYGGDVDAAKAGLGLTVDISGLWPEDPVPEPAAAPVPPAEPTDDLDLDDFDFDDDEDEHPAEEAEDKPANQSKKPLDMQAAAAIAQMGEEWDEKLHATLRAAIFKEATTELARKYAKRAVHGAGTTATWLPPADFAAKWLASEAEDPPTILRRTDGVAFIPSGRVSQIVGPPGAGKTWLAMLASMQLLQDGGKVMYYDFEDRKDAFRQRCHHIGFGDVVDQAAGNRFFWKDPGALPSDLEDVLDFLAQFGLVVFDVTNRLIVRAGGDVTSGGTEVMGLYDSLFTPIARSGPAVLLLDHPTKKGWKQDAELADMQAGGSALKLGNVDGTSILMTPQVPFTKKTLAGSVLLTNGKSRTGDFAMGGEMGTLLARRNLEGGVVPGAGDDDEDLILAGVGMLLTIAPPGPPETEAQRIAKEVDLALRVATKEVVPRIVKYLEGHGGEASVSDVKNSMNAKHRKYVNDAIYHGSELFTEYDVTVGGTPDKDGTLVGGKKVPYLRLKPSK